MLKAGWDSDGNVGCFLHSAGNSAAFVLLAREVLGRKRSLDDVVIFVHIDAVKVSFLMNSLFTLADTRYTNTAGRDPSKEVEEQESYDFEDAVEEVWDVSELYHSNECGL